MTKSTYSSCERPIEWYNLTKKFCANNLGTQLFYDSGSPMICQYNNNNKNNNAILVGIHSLQHQTNVSYFSKWITDTAVSTLLFDTFQQFQTNPNI